MVCNRSSCTAIYDKQNRCSRYFWNDIPFLFSLIGSAGLTSVVSLIRPARCVPLGSQRTVSIRQSRMHMARVCSWRCSGRQMVSTAGAWIRDALLSWGMNLPDRERNSDSLAASREATACRRASGQLDRVGATCMCAMRAQSRVSPANPLTHLSPLAARFQAHVRTANVQVGAIMVKKPIPIQCY